MARFVGIVELDDSFFGLCRVRGRPDPRKRGRGTTKQPVFWIYERDGRIYTELASNCCAMTLQKIIGGRVSLDSVILTDGWRGYDGLVDVVSTSIYGSTRASTLSPEASHQRDRGLLEFYQTTAGQVQRGEEKLRP
jgi:transposase-like protein